MSIFLNLSCGGVRSSGPSEPEDGINANTGYFSLAGQDAGLARNSIDITADHGSFTLAGQDATLTDSGGPSVTYANDQANITEAYGVSTYISGYTGPLIRVDNGTTELDIYADAATGHLDLTALDAHLVTGDNEIVKVYAQSGTSAHDLTITSDHPVMFKGLRNDAGTLAPVKFENNKVAIPTGVTGDGRNFTAYDLFEDYNHPNVNDETKAVHQVGAVYNGTGSVGQLGQSPNRIISSAGFDTSSWGDNMMVARAAVHSLNGTSTGKVYLGLNKNLEETGSTIAAGNFAGAYLGLNVAAWDKTGLWFGWVLYDEDRRADNSADVDAFATMLGLSTALRDHKLLVLGDSIQAGSHSDKLRPHSLLASYDAPVDIHKSCKFGNTAANTYTRRTSYSGFYDATKTSNSVFIHVGSADIFAGTTGANLWTNSILPLIQYYEGLGCTVFVGTLIDRTDAGFTAGMETHRDTVNASILSSSNQSTYSYTAVDFTTIEPITKADGVHPTDVAAGYPAMATVWETAYNAVIHP